MVFMANFSFFSDISMIFKLSNLELGMFIEMFSGLTMYNFSKYSNSTRFGQKKFFAGYLFWSGDENAEPATFMNYLEPPEA